MTRSPVLTTRQLNRALLARQLLLVRSTLAVADALEHVGGLQTQYAPAGYIGLWSRVAGFERPMLTRALEDRRAIQATLMRATIHTVSASDYWPMTIGIRRIRREWYEGVGRREIGGIDMAAAAAAVREELAGGPLPMRILTARLEARGLPAAAARWAGMWVDLVRVPPSGTWEQRRADLYGLAETWIPPPAEITEEDGMEVLVRRYLGGFGPARPRDVATWMGVRVRDMKAVLDRMDLPAFRDEAGGTLVDLPDSPRPAADVPVPPRFLPVWDASLLVHARRTQILPEAYRPRVFNTKTPHSVNTFLLDGQVAGSWRHERGEIRLEPFRALSAGERSELEVEAHRLAALHA